jgi:hypothetical protein
MADEKQQPQANAPKGMAAAASAHSNPTVTQGSTGDEATRQQRGGPQEDQLSGETQKGAHNNEMRGANPQGNRPDRNQSARQKGDTF